MANSNCGGLFTHFRHVLQQLVCRQPIRISSTLRGYGTAYGPNQREGSHGTAARMDCDKLNCFRKLKLLALS